MEWKELHAPSTDKNNKIVNYKEYTQGMREVEKGVYALDINDDFIELDSEKGMEYFKYCDQVTILLTNACNLGCKYCYEQHRHSFGKFTIDKFLKIVEFLKKIPNSQVKNIQFFGGEPLLEKDFILECCKEFDKRYRDEKFIRLSMITNGILLSKEFIDEYFSYPFTTIGLSVDIDKVEMDNRGLTQENLNNIFTSLDYINKNFHEKMKDKVMFRTTIAQNQVDRFEGFLERFITDFGLQSITIHPLTMSAESGLIIWKQENFDKLEKALDILSKKYDTRFIFLEGAGYKGQKNCIMASDGFSMDASGDISGCYFVINRKNELGSLVLGNLFENKLYYKRFEFLYNELQKMINTQEQCKNCTHEFCYQCSAGNYTSFGVLYRPDENCQRLIQLSDKINIIYQKRQIEKKFKSILESFIGKTKEEINFKLLKMLCLLFQFDLTYQKLDGEEFINFEKELEKHKDTKLSTVLYWYKKFITGELEEKDFCFDKNNISKFFDIITKEENKDVTLESFVKEYLKIKNIQMDNIDIIDKLDNEIAKDTFYITTLHVIVLNWFDKRRINRYMDNVILSSKSE